MIKIGWENHRGIALMGATLLLILLSVLALGLYSLLTAETRIAGNEYFSNQAFYAAVAGMEKMTNDLSKVYAFKTSPDPSDFAAIMSAPPSIDGYTFSTSQGGEYNIAFSGAAAARTIPSGPYEGLIALVQPYKLFVTAVGDHTKVEARLRRDFLNNLIPIFQFGIFYDGDLEAHAGPNFNFGGRVHTNGDFYVTAGSTTIFNSRVTVVGEVVRDVRKNGDSAGPGGDPPFSGHVYVLDGARVRQELLMSGTGEGGSVIGGSGQPMTPSGTPNPVWSSYSVTKFGGNLLNHDTGAKAIKLPLQVARYQTIELIRRGRSDDSAMLRQSRYYYKPGLRIMLSDCDRPGQYPGSTGCCLTPSGTCAPVGPRPPAIFLSNTHLRVEILDNAGTVTDVTRQFLNAGITVGESSATPILRLQRPNAYGPDDGALYPINFYDMREGEIEDTVDSMAGLAGIMNTVELDIGNFGRWLSGALTGGAVPPMPNNNGYVIYFSDRRGDLGGSDGNGNAEFDYEDTIFRNDALDPGEDLNENGRYDGLEKPAPLDYPTTAGDFISRYLQNGSSTRMPTFRRSLRLVNGQLLPAPLTVAAENPIYVKGDYNSITTKPASIVGDAITMLSNSWDDANSYKETVSMRPASATTLNAALIAGNTMSVYASPRPAYRESHSSGGVHNFIRFLENWSGVTFTYTGSLVNLYHSRQAIGQWKCCVTVYSPPIRNWTFDVGFLDPAKLPPATPNLNVVEIQRLRQDLFQARR
jgi:hypothetical protein